MGPSNPRKPLPVTGMSIVNSWNEWDPLREVIVGSARGAVDIELRAGALTVLSARECWAYAPRTAHTLFARRGGTPTRQFRRRCCSGSASPCAGPIPIDHAVAAQTPDWQIAGGHACACPRDTLLVIGDEIIEAPMAQCARWFEFRAYRTLITEYFRGGARWTVAPKPQLRDDLYTEAASYPFDFLTGRRCVRASRFSMLPASRALAAISSGGRTLSATRSAQIGCTGILDPVFAFTGSASRGAADAHRYHVGPGASGHRARQPVASMHGRPDRIVHGQRLAAHRSARLGPQRTGAVTRREQLDFDEYSHARPKHRGR